MITEAEPEEKLSEASGQATESNVELEQLQLKCARLELIIVLGKVIEKLSEEEFSKTRTGRKIKRLRAERDEWKRKARSRRCKYSAIRKQLKRSEDARNKNELLLREIRRQVLRAKLCDTFPEDGEGLEGGWKSWKRYVSRVTDVIDWLITVLPPNEQEQEIIDTPAPQRKRFGRFRAILRYLFPEHKEQTR